MTHIGKLVTEKSIELAIKEITEWLQKINVSGLDIDLRYDAKSNVAMLKFKYKGKDYEFRSTKQANCRLNMWGIARVIEWRVRGQLMGIEDFGESMFRYKLEGHVEPPGAATPSANDLNYVKLGLSPLASNKEVIARHKELMKTFHPDMTLSSEAKKEHERRTAEINEAYDAIKKERGIE